MWDDNLLSGEPLALCPVRALQLAPREMFDRLTRWKDQYTDFKKGNLLVPGGISAQPALWLEAMHYLESLEKQQQSRFVTLKRAQDGDG